YGNCYTLYDSPYPGLKLTFRPYVCGEATFTRTPTLTQTPSTPSATLTRTPTVTSTPTQYPGCGTGADYDITVLTGQTLTPANNFVTGSLCDDCILPISLPFTY